MSEAVDNPAPSSGVTLRHTRSAVILSADSGTPQGAFAHVTGALAEKGFTAIPDSSPDGTCLLRISGYKEPQEITRLLKQQGIAPREIDPTPSERLKTLDRVKNHSLSLSGITYLLGDISLFIAGAMQGDTKKAIAGLGYSAGGLASAIYGNPSEARQIRNVGVRMGDFLSLQGADIPAGSAVRDVLKQRRGGMAERAENFLYRYPSETHNLIYAVAGTQLMASGLGQRKAGDKDWWKNAAAGGLVTAGGLVGGLVPEKRGEDNHSTGILHWMKEQPLRLTGYLYTLNNGFLIAAAHSDYKKQPANKSYIFTAATAGFFLVANAFMSMTSRSHASQGAEAEDRRHVVEGMAAEVIAAQPEAARADLTRKVAGFLSLQPETKQEQATLEASIARKVAALENSPWTKASTCPTVQESATPEPPLPVKSWTEKLNTVPPAPAEAMQRA